MYSVGIGIDWVAVLILLGAYAFAQVRSIAPSVRYGVFAAAAGIIALYKLRSGAAGANMFFVLVAGALAVWYGIQAIRAARRPGPRSK
jgi:hypothetical protein